MEDLAWLSAPTKMAKPWLGLSLLRDDARCQGLFSIWPHWPDDSASFGAQAALGHVPSILTCAEEDNAARAGAAHT
jgi:hypothetical protein